YVCWAAQDRCSVYDQRIGARCDVTLVEHRVELQRAAIGDESSEAGTRDKGVDRQGRLADHEHVASDGGALQIDRARIDERRHADQLTLHRPVERHCVVEVAEREILPRRVQLRGAWCSEQRKRSEIGEAIVWVGAKVRYSHPERIASAPRGVGEMSQIE